MDFAQMTQKWSCKPKKDKAARIRDNQRRHRARTKAYIMDLEEQLAATKSKLEEALARNEELEAQIRQLCQSRTGKVAVQASAQTTSRVTKLAVGLSGTQNRIVAEDLTRDASLLLALGEEHILAGSPGPAAYSSSTSNGTSSNHDCSSPTSDSNVHSPPPQSPAGVASPKTSTPCSCGSLGEDVTGDANATGHGNDPDCNHLPPPAPGESTIHCKTAYKIIEDRNFKGMGPNAIQQRLGPGFRRAVVQGDGCRVDSHLVFALIDDISAT